MKQIYNPSVIVLSFGISFLGSYIAITACEQYRLCRIGIVQSRYIPPIAYLMVMSICLGGVGIWCMHFVGMSAVEMEIDGVDMMVRFDTGLTLLSLFFVLTLTMLGFYISSFDKVFMKTKHEIVEMFVEDAHKMSMRKIKNITIFQTIAIIGTRAPQHLLLGGFCTGSGVVVMHYVGMAAMLFKGRIVWDVGIIAASAIIAFLASTAAFWILFRLLSIYPNMENLRVACAFTMAIAVCGMHYVGMSAASFVYDPNKDVPTGSGSITDQDAFNAGVVSAALVALVAAMIALADLRHSVLKLSTELYRADRVILAVPTVAHSTCAVNIQRYVARRRHGKFSLGVLNETVTVDHEQDHSEEGSTGSGGHEESESCCVNAWHQFQARHHSFEMAAAGSSAHVHPVSSYAYMEQSAPRISEVSYKPELAVQTGTTTQASSFLITTTGADATNDATTAGSFASAPTGTSSSVPSSSAFVYHRSPRLGSHTPVSAHSEANRAKNPEVSIHSMA